MYLERGNNDMFPVAVFLLRYDIVCRKSAKYSGQRRQNFHRYGSNYNERYCSYKNGKHFPAERHYVLTFSLKRDKKNE